MNDNDQKSNSLVIYHQINQSILISPYHLHETEYSEIIKQETAV